MMKPVNNDLIMTTCAICGTDTHDHEVYAANFRPEDLNPEVFSARRLPDLLHYRMVVCRQCGLMRANPVLSKDALSVLYAESHAHQPHLYQAAADTYGRYFQENFSPFPFQARVLEIGCGPGFFLKVLMQNNCNQVHGVEPSREAVEQSGELKGLIFNGMFGSGIYPPDYFDLICAFQMFDHLENPRQFLKDCRDYLKPRGDLFLILHDIKSWPAKILGPHCPMLDIEHPILYDYKTIVKILEANGFTVQKKFSILNRYPLRYWLQLMPLPKGLKTSLLGFLQETPIGNIPVSLGLGNMGIIARKKDE
jgi:2-polyprenyl-3-methyl-5-hydroxy-6-metoxy-1,4-benzoquinol methylase